MHMTSHPQHLRNEDRPDFERALDEVLRSTPRENDPAVLTGRPNTEQLRTHALARADEIAQAAAVEYGHYLDLRDGLRRLADSAGEPDSDTAESAVTREADASGPGAGAVAVVLAPLLAGASAVVLLLIGYVLKMVTPEPAMARTLLTAGWVFGALAAGGLLTAAAGLLVTALRNGARAYHVEPRHPQDADLERARLEWLEALREFGLQPFLEKASASASRVAPAGGPLPAPGDQDVRPGARREPGRMTSPRFSSPGYSSPDFSSPDRRNT
ncbi:hypothetical protein [Streptomyces sp. NPDC056600]|uniref:hypothetical protein n=1 Tax=Streptomyces sp. NPDC056600 TaxID=3345874 RepID=UPI0036BDE980